MLDLVQKMIHESYQLWLEVLFDKLSFLSRNRAEIELILKDVESKKPFVFQAIVLINF